MNHKPLVAFRLSIRLIDTVPSSELSHPCDSPQRCKNLLSPSFYLGLSCLISDTT